MNENDEFYRAVGAKFTACAKFDLVPGMFGWDHDGDYVVIFSVDSDDPETIEEEGGRWVHYANEGNAYAWPYADVRAGFGPDVSRLSTQACILDLIDPAAQLVSAPKMLWKAGPSSLVYVGKDCRGSGASPAGALLNALKAA